jgi:membrane dipeptidase
MLLACEGADFIEDHYDRFGVSYDKGVRSVQLMHYRSNGYGDLQTQPERYGGLTAAGARIVREMNQLGILIDLAHASYRTTRDAVRLSDQPVMVSHTHLKHTRSDHPRLITPGHARLIAASGGVIGVWPSGHSLQTFEDFVQEIVRLVSLVGVDHVGIGTDMDANYKPVMNRYDQWSVINDSLEAAGFSSAEIDKVLGGNAARLLGTVLG